MVQVRDDLRCYGRENEEFCANRGLNTEGGGGGWIVPMGLAADFFPGRFFCPPIWFRGQNTFQLFNARLLSAFRSLFTARNRNYPTK